MKRGTILKNLWAGHETYFVYMGFPVRSGKAEAKKTGGYLLVNVDGKWHFRQAQFYCASITDREHFPVVGHIDFEKMCIAGIVEAIRKGASDENACANKCGLECIRTNVERVCVKPEKGQCPRCEQLVGEGLDLIQRLEADNSRLNDTIRSLTDLLNAAHEETAAVKRERDAAVSELPHHCWNCKYHLDKPIEETDGFGRTIHIYCEADCCYPDEENSSWEWRGVRPDTEVQEDV